MASHSSLSQNGQTKDKTRSEVEIIKAAIKKRHFQQAYESISKKQSNAREVSSKDKKEERIAQ